MNTIPKLWFCADGTVLSGARRLLRAQRGNEALCEALVNILPELDILTYHFQASHDWDMATELLQTPTIVDTLAAYIDSAQIDIDLCKFFDYYVDSGGEIAIILPPLLAREKKLHLLLQRRLSYISDDVQQIVGLDIEAIDAHSVVITGRTDETRFLLKRGAQTIIYANNHRLIRELDMRSSANTEAAESRH